MEDHKLLAWRYAKTAVRSLCETLVEGVPSAEGSSKRVLMVRITSCKGSGPSSSSLCSFMQESNNLTILEWVDTSADGFLIGVSMICLIIRRFWRATSLNLPKRALSPGRGFDARQPPAVRHNVEKDGTVQNEQNALLAKS
jgi:hypothetical protein